MPYRVLRQNETMNRVGRKATSFTKLLKDDPSFPKPVKITSRINGWLEHEVDEYIARLMAEREEPT